MILNTKIAFALLLAMVWLAPAQVNAAMPDQCQVTASDSQEGKWLTGDIHVHTALSADARSALERVVELGFARFGLDYIAVSNHLRNNSRDNIGRADISTSYSNALAQYELPALQQLQQKYPDKLLVSTFEWDAPAHDHLNIGILLPLSHIAEKVAVTRYFDYRFGAKNNATDFTPEQIALFAQAGTKRENRTHQDTVNALRWLQDNYPQASYAMLNHPTRYATSYTMADIRALHDAAPDIFFLIEGMVGNQFNGERGDYGTASRAGLLGGVDPFMAQLGGNWDALLGEGRHLWLVANSDHHFKMALPYASGYYPGEYAKTYLYIAGAATEPLSYSNWLRALKSGNSFAVYGDLITALDFQIAVKHSQATMGQTLKAAPGQRVSVTIRFKQPKSNNQEAQVGNERYRGPVPALQRIDLIVGEVTEKAAADTPAYQATSNSSTRVLQSFTAKDWQCDEQGYYAIHYQYMADRNHYLRLRGTNLSSDEQGLTRGGEPQRSAVISIDSAGGQAYYQRLNKRNYRDLWFYTNPIFMQVTHSDSP